MLAGGLLDTAGTLSYHRRWPDLYPSVFGYHEVFHAYVCAAAACQYLGEGFRGNGTSNAGHRAEDPAAGQGDALD